MQKCIHEDNIDYLDLIQIDGDPFYIVKCPCGEYGLIKLVESTNEFGFNAVDMANLLKENKYKSYLWKD